MRRLVSGQQLLWHTISSHRVLTTTAVSLQNGFRNGNDGRGGNWRGGNRSEGYLDGGNRGGLYRESDGRDGRNRGGGGGGGGGRGGYRDSGRHGSDFRNRDNQDSGFHGGGRDQSGFRGGNRRGERDDRASPYDRHDGGRAARGGGGRQRGREDQSWGGGHDSGQRGNSHGEGRGDQKRRTPEDYFEQNAQSLFDMKRQYKQAKSARERRFIQRSARQLVRRSRLDPSSQDERSVSVFLNCAATFRCFPGESIEQAAQWMRRNLNGVSPQNLALFANALGVMHPPDTDVMLRDEVCPAVEAVMKDMTPVEVVMVLQALQRARVSGNEKLQDEMLRQLFDSISSMPVQQLSTLASVLGKHTLKTRDEALWKRLVEAVMKKTLGDIDRMHSREAITLLQVAPFLGVPEADISRLMSRATATAGFHTDDQIGELLQAICNVRLEVPNPGEELRDNTEALLTALINRLDRVAEFTDLASASMIWKYSSLCGLHLSTSVQERILQSLMRELGYNRHRFSSLRKLANSMATQKLPSTQLLDAISDYCVGLRPPRTTDGPPPGSDGSHRNPEGGDDEGSYKVNLYGRFLGDLVEVRISLENALAANGGTPNESLATVLPNHLLNHMAEASPRQMLKAVQAISLAQDDCPLRNKANDEALLLEIQRNVEANKAAFIEQLHPNSVGRFIERVGSAPKAQRLVQLLQEG